MSLSFTFYRKNFGERWVPFCNHSAFINSVLQQKWGLKILICLHFLNLMGFVHSSFLMITPMLSVDCIAIKILYTIKHDKYTVINLPHFFEWKAKKSSLFCNKDTRHSRNCLILLIACNDKMHPCKQYTGINIWIAFVCAALVAVWCLTDSKIWPLLVIIFCPDWSIMGGLCAIRESCMLNVWVWNEGMWECVSNPLMWRETTAENGEGQPWSTLLCIACSAWPLEWAMPSAALKFYIKQKQTQKT